jgi:hypothetical protein
MRADNNPMLYEQHRRTIGAGFIKKLCKEDYDSRRNRGQPAALTVTEIWKDNLGSFDRDKVAPLAVRFFRDEKHYITQSNDGRISLTEIGRQHCNDEDKDLALPEHYQP